MTIKRSKLFAVLTLALAAIFFLAACQGQSSSTKTSSSSSSKEAEAVSGASEKEYTDPSQLKEEYDVIIIGGGGGGMASAISATDAGAKVAIFEKMPVVGGNTSKSSAGMNASETKFQKEQGIEDSNDKFYEETLTGGKNTNDTELLRYLVDNSASAIEWLDSMDITLDNITTTGGMSVNRTHRPTDGSAVGQYLVEGLYANVTERKIPTFVNANVTAINEKDGAVSGVTVKIDGKEKTVKAKSVIIATGGFGANVDMVTELQPNLKGYVSTNQEGSTGDGLEMAQKLGAAVVDMDKIQIHPTVEQETAYLITEAVRGEGAILVNQDGKRFINELDTRDVVSKAIIDLPEKYAYVIFDQALTERVKAIAQYEKQELVVKADSLEELAKKLEIPADQLSSTLEAWNKAVQAGSDSEFNRSTGMENDLSKAPYYAIKVAPGIHHTMGGLKINTKTEVLKESGEAIKGLYAAGEATGGVHGSNRIGGNAVADIIIFGRQAGNQAAEYSK